MTTMPATIALEVIWCPIYFTSALDHPSWLRALAEVLLVPTGGDARLGAADWALETAKVTSLSDER